MVEPLRPHPAGLEAGAGNDLAEVVEVRAYAANARCGQGGFHGCERILPVASLHLDFHQQRIVEGADLRPRLHPAIAPDISGKADLGDQSGARLEILRGILRIDPHLDRRAFRFDAVHPGNRVLPGSEANHPLHQIDPGDELRHAVLDLQAGVHLQEIELLAAGIEKELNRPRRAVGERFTEPHRRRKNAVPHRIR